MSHWTDKHPPLKTLKPIAFRALQPNLSITNNEVHALLKPGALSEWASPADFLIELRKSYHDCGFDNPTSPTKIIFSSNDGMRFYSDFEAFMAAQQSTRQPG